VTVLLLIFQEALRRASRWTVWGLFLLVPLILTPYWIWVNELGLFPWFKFYSVFFCVCWGTALRFTSLGDRAWARATIPLLLAMNIFEAVLPDLVEPGWAHGLNAAAGLLLIATMPYGSNSARVRSAGGCCDLHYRTSKRWVIGYTLWNWTFVYLNYPELTGHHTAVLAAALIVAMVDPFRWGQTRASTLGVNLLFCATYFNGMIVWMDTSSWFDERFGIGAAGLAFIFMAGYAVQLGVSQMARIEERFTDRRLSQHADLSTPGFSNGRMRLTWT
jgi:hypothetical protein